MLPAIPMRAALDPDWQFQLYPQEATPGNSRTRRQVNAFIVADVLKDLMAATASDFGGLCVSSATAGQWQDWSRLGSGLTVKGAGFVRFLGDGTIVGAGPGPCVASGFYMLPTEIALPSGIVGENAPAPLNLNWQALKGKWKRTKQLRQGVGGTAIANVGSETQAIAQTTMGIGAQIGLRQPLIFEIDCLAQSGSSRPELLIQFAPNLRLALRQGMPPQLEIQNTLTQTIGGIPTSLGVWGSLRRMDAWGKFSPRHGKARCIIRQIGGRLCWEMDGHSQWILGAPDAGDASKTGKALSHTWGQSPLRVEATNLRVRLEVLSLSTKGQLATVTRRVSKREIANQGLSGKPRGGGHIPNGARIETSVTEGADFIDYTAFLHPDDDGFVTPLLSQMNLVWEPVWVRGNVAGSDISRAITSCSVNHAHPPLQAGTEGEFTLDTVTARHACPAALDFIKDRCTIEISARWRDNGGNVVDGYRGLFRGYLSGTRGEEPRYNEGRLTFTLRDPILRLRDGAAVVDGHAAPLDQAFWRKLDAATASAGSWEENGKPFVTVIQDGGTLYRPLTAFETAFYDVECVQEILRQFLGPEEAARLNGGNLFALLPANHPPLLQFGDAVGAYVPLADALGVTLSSASLKMQNGFVFEPPYESDALTWINRFCEDFFTLFFYGNIDRDMNSWPVPLYGRFDEIMSRSRLFPVSPLELSNLGTETRPERDFSRVWVLGNSFDTQIPLSPSLFQGEAALPPSHPNSGYKSFERTKVLKTNLAISAPSVMATAAIAMSELDNGGLLGQWPTYTYRAAREASRDAQVGDVFYCSGATQLQSVNNVWFRAAKLSHQFTQDPTKGRDWVTTASLERLSKRQLRVFSRANGLPIPV